VPILCRSGRHAEVVNGGDGRLCWFNGSLLLLLVVVVVVYYRDPIHLML